jgi:hypothetical protein
VRVRTPGDRLLFDAPKGVLTPEVQQAIRNLKTQALDALHEEERLLDLPLSEFERQQRAIEIKVPFLTETLWLIPDVSHIETLSRAGVSRGRIWTAGELEDLWSVSPEPSKDFERLARLRQTFNAEIVYVGPGSESGNPNA